MNQLTVKKPRITGNWELLFLPEKFGNYVNDHCVIKGKDNKWHLFGITSFVSIPANEIYFVHAEANTLTGGCMIEKNKVIEHGTRAWAPCVIQNGDQYFMYYGPSPTQLAISNDLNEWMGYPIKMYGEPTLGSHRDHMVIKINDYTWIMYVVGVYQNCGCISCYVSNDLLSWRFVQYALTSSDDAPLKPAWGAFESPFVVKYNELYYLFTTYTDSSNENYQDTLVFCSSNPYDFGCYTSKNSDSTCIAKIQAHAGEVIYDKDSESYYITNCGWRNKGIPHEGGVSIAKLEWF